VSGAGGASVVQAVTVTVNNPNFSLPSYADQCINTAYQRYAGSTTSIPNAPSPQWYVPGSYCYSGSGVSSPGGCPAVVKPDLTVLQSCLTVNVALMCGKITPTEYKNYIVSRQLQCIG
jgi:hypothetical protein